MQMLTLLIKFTPLQLQWLQLQVHLLAAQAQVLTWLTGEALEAILAHHHQAVAVDLIPFHQQ
jgi:hypothetical protein